MVVQYSELRPTSGWDLLASLRHPCKFQCVSRLGSVSARQSSSGHQPNFAALNIGRHLYSAGRPSRWAFAHILVWFVVDFLRNSLYNKMHKKPTTSPHVKMLHNISPPTSPQQIHNKSNQCSLDFDLLSLVVTCSAAANHRTDHNNEPRNRTYDVRYLRANLQQIYNRSNSCTTTPQHSIKFYSLLYNKSTTYAQQIKLEALGQCIPPPRHVLPVTRYGSRSVIRIATKI